MNTLMQINANSTSVNLFFIQVFNSILREIKSDLGV